MKIDAEQANKLHEDFKRGAHVHAIIAARVKEKPIEDEILRVAVKLALEEYDALYGDFTDKLTGENQGGPHE